MPASGSKTPWGAKRLDSPPESPELEAIDAWLEAALDQEPSERQDFLARSCKDERIRRRVLELLQGLEDEDPLLPSDGGFHRDLTRILGASEPADEPIPERLGPFIIDGELGRGGMGVVYRARRQRADFEQRLALKVIRGVADSPATRRRFTRERWILAALSHPNIGRLLDGGHLDDGRPYLAIELVDGIAIDRFCNQRRLGLRQRIKLFLDVARAIEHAHRLLVVHRDIKPANILVDHEGEPRLLDFGIAALVDGARPTDQLTATHHRPMTPAYASPEQLAGGTITTASDVYQLGLLLFTLLTGRRPYPPSIYRVDPQRAVLEIPAVTASKAVARTEPPTGSESDEAGSFDPGLSARKLRHRLKGDLDRILATALRKEPERRYGSVEALIRDLEAFLEGRPVAAQADSAGYRLAKWMGRHRLAVTVAAMAVTVLTAAGVLHTVRLGEERDRARREALRANSTAEFLADLFRGADPVSQGAEPPTVRQLLDRGAAELEQNLQQDPSTRARLEAQMADIYFSLGLYERAESQAQKALQDFARVHDHDHPEVLRTHYRLALIYGETQRMDQAEALLRRVLDAQRESLGQGHPETLDSMVALAATFVGKAKGLPAEAEGLLETVLAYDRLPGREIDVDDRMRLAEALMRLGDSRACSIYENLIPPLVREVGATHSRSGRVFYNLAVCRWHVEGKTAAALDPLISAVEARRSALGPGHHRTLESVRLMGYLLKDLERWDEAEKVLAEAIEEQRRQGLGGPRWNRTEALWIEVQIAGGKTEAAAEALTAWIDRDPFSASQMGPLICALAPLLKTDDAVDQARDWLDRLADALDRDPLPVKQVGCRPQDVLAEL